MHHPTEFTPTSAEKIARNDATFREANEGIAEVAEDVGFEEPIPFFCECADPLCKEIVRMELDSYNQMRREPRDFVNAVGHQVAAQGWAEVIAETDAYVIVRKVGRAGEVATELAGNGEDG